MKPTHHHDTKAYHDYYIHQAGKRYPVFAGRRYQRGHGLGSIFDGLFKAAMPLLKKGAKTLGREVLKTPGLVYVIIVVSFRIVMMSWFHSRENSCRPLYLFPRSEIVVVTGDNTVSDQTLG
jgi:hypothetical protein